MCSLYFASMVMLKKHVAIHKETSAGPIKILERPLQIVSKRQRELMAIILHSKPFGLLIGASKIQQ